MELQYTTGRPKISPWNVFGVGSSLLAFMILAIAALRGTKDNAAVAVLVLGILAVCTIPIATRMSRIAGDRKVFAFVMAGFGMKMLASLARYWMAFLSPSGVADAAAYDDAARKLAPAIRALNFGVNTGAPVPGTGFIRLLTATMYAIVGSNPAAAFLIFAWLAFIGVLFFWRAFHLALPEADSQRYLKLVLFLPSMLFWPGGIGKDAWMVFGLGLCAYGVAGVITRRPAGLALIPGILATTMVRPHVSLLVYCGLIFALILRKRKQRTAATPAFALIGLLVMLGLGVAVVTQTAQFLGVEKITLESVDEELSFAELQTGAEAGSAFAPVSVRTPLDIPLATITVLFRPLPFEAHNTGTLIAAGECVVLLGLVWSSRARLRGIFRRMRNHAYVGFSFGFVAVFIIAFSNFSNFGILARERVQMLPFFLVFLALPKLARKARVRPGPI